MEQSRHWNRQKRHTIESALRGLSIVMNQVGMELADKLLENKYSYVIATHIEKEHCHNHIIFCAVDNVEHKKYNDGKRTYRHIRSLSDELCKEHGLSVITPPRQKGKTHYEWQMAKSGTSWKGQMKSDMDNAICEAYSYEDFISRMQTKGYEIKGETFGDNALKYLSFSASGLTRFTRVSEKNFGEGYTKEAIREQIERRVKAQEKFLVKKKIPFPKRPDAKRILIDTDKEKFQVNGALKHWVDIQNLKIAAASYA